MEINLGNMTCIYCRSVNLEFADWFSDQQYENLDDILFMDEVEEHIRDNFEIDPEQEFLFHCKNCEKYFLFNINTKKIGLTLLPFAKENKLPSFCFLILDPIKLIPIILQIGNLSLEITEFSQSTPPSQLRFYNHTGPFYPYPTNIYNLICSIDYSVKSSQCFRMQIEKQPILFHLFDKNIDLEFFMYNIKWYSPEGEDVLLHLANINNSIEQNNILQNFDDFLNTGNFMSNTVPKIISENISKIASSLRNQQAYRFLNWLENKLRLFVWDEYRTIYSEQINSAVWWKGCFPKEVIEKIQSNQLNDEKIGQRVNTKFPLAYSDFDNLFTLLEKEWKNINKKLRKDIDVIRGHFKYMKHFRNSIAHSRYLSNEDLMELQSNAIKFLKMIGQNEFEPSNVIFYKNIQ